MCTNYRRFVKINKTNVSRQQLKKKNRVYWKAGLSYNNRATYTNRSDNSVWMVPETRAKSILSCSPKSLDSADGSRDRMAATATAAAAAAAVAVEGEYSLTKTLLQQECYRRNDDRPTVRNKARSIVAAIGSSAFHRLQRHRAPVTVKLRKLVRDDRGPFHVLAAKTRLQPLPPPWSAHGSITPLGSRPAEYEIPEFSTNVFNSPFLVRRPLNYAFWNDISATTNI